MLQHTFPSALIDQLDQVSDNLWKLNAIIERHIGYLEPVSEPTPIPQAPEPTPISQVPEPTPIPQAPRSKRKQHCRNEDVLMGEPDSSKMHCHIAPPRQFVREISMGSVTNEPRYTPVSSALTDSMVKQVKLEDLTVQDFQNWVEAPSPEEKDFQFARSFTDFEQKYHDDSGETEFISWERSVLKQFDINSSCTLSQKEYEEAVQVVENKPDGRQFLQSLKRRR